MRIVAGEFKGRRLRAPKSGGTRPTADRVREAMFNALTSALGDFEGVTVVDLFAGSGALGIEALSRGAEHATFLDKGYDAWQVIKGNLSDLGITGARATVVRLDVMRHAIPPGPYDVAFADPPYRFNEWEALVSRIDSRLLVAESDRELPPLAGWDPQREKRYGTTVVTLLRKGGQ